MAVDDLFIVRETKTSEILSGNSQSTQTDESHSDLKYPDWVVKNVLNGFTTTFDLEFNKNRESFLTYPKFPDGRSIKTNVFDELPDERFYRWLSDRICGILDAYSVPHSTVNFDIEYYRTYHSLKMRVFVIFGNSVSQFFNSAYKIYTLAKYCSRCMHVYTKMRIGRNDRDYNTSCEVSVTTSVDYVNEINELFELCYLIETLNKNDKLVFEQLSHYQHYFKFEIIGNKLPIYMEQPTFINHRGDDLAKDVHVMLEIIRKTLKAFNKHLTISENDLERCFIDESLLFLKAFKKLFNQNAIYKDYIIRLWTDCEKELRKKCADDIFNYIIERDIIKEVCKRL